MENFENKKEWVNLEIELLSKDGIHSGTLSSYAEGQIVSTFFKGDAGS